jgi:5'-AMP-activated protein kinase, catalytic alpha subunit
MADESKINDCKEVDKPIEKYFKHGKVIGDGTFGEVSVGYPTLLAISELRDDFPEQIVIKRVSKDLFVPDEIKFLSSIEELGLMKWYGCFYDKKTENYYVIMEYIEGGDLFDIIISDNLSEQDKENITEQLIRIVIKLHKVGIVHRDIKPENIVIKRNGEIRLIDYGLSCHVFEGYGQCDSASGSLDYLDPYIKEGMNIFQLNQADWWATYVTIYILWEGRPLFMDGTWYPVIIDDLNMPDDIAEYLALFLNDIRPPEEREGGEQILKIYSK